MAILGPRHAGNMRQYAFEDFKQLDYQQSPFGSAVDMARWRAEGYAHPGEYFTGHMVDARSPQPDWTGDLEMWAENRFQIHDVASTFYRMRTGTILPVHSDSYPRYSALFNVPVDKIVRVIMMMEDWASGHYLEIDGVPYVGWREGDYFSWTGDTPHMAANIGVTPRYTLQLTGHK